MKIIEDNSKETLKRLKDNNLKLSREKKKGEKSNQKPEKTACKLVKFQIDTFILKTLLILKGVPHSIAGDDHPVIRRYHVTKSRYQSSLVYSLHSKLNDIPTLSGVISRLHSK